MWWQQLAVDGGEGMLASIQVQCRAIRSNADCLGHATPKPVCFMAPHHHIFWVEPMALRGLRSCVHSPGIRDVSVLKAVSPGVSQSPWCKMQDSQHIWLSTPNWPFFFHREPVFRSHQTGSDCVVGVDVGHHTSTSEKASYLVRNLAHIHVWDDDTPDSVISCQQIQQFYKV